MTTPEQPGDSNNPTPGQPEQPGDSNNPTPGGQADDDAKPKKRKPTALIAGGGIAAVAVIVAIVFGSLYATDTAPFGGGDDDADISNAAKAYVNAFNSEKVDNVRAVLCSDDAAMLANVKDGEGTDTPITVKSVSDIAVEDSTATAKLTASMDVEGQPNQQDVTLAFKNEGGNWKVCPSLNPAAGAPQGGQQAPQGGQQVPQGGAQPAPAPQQGGQPAQPAPAPAPQGN
ncbi:MAG: hypothetical protein L0H59_02265, partial [Tomitella sp.]|nr:hypothetical protein [Tomitella sp.]